MFVKDVFKYKSWDDVINEIKQRKIHCPHIATGQLLIDIQEIKSVAHKSFFKKPQEMFPYERLNQVQYYKNEGVHHSFIDDLHNIASLIREAKLLPSKSKLIPHIFTQFGFYSQFLITVWLSRFFKIKDLEVNNKPLNSDILIEYLGEDIYFQVKDITQQESELRVDEAVMTIDSIFSNKARARRDDRVLRVVDFEGVPPKKYSDSYWYNFALSLEEKPQVLEKILTSADNQKIKIKIKLDWGPWSGTFRSPTSSFNNFGRLKIEYDSLNNKITNSLYKKYINILIVVTQDKYDWKDISKSIKNDNLGLIFVEVFDNTFERSPVLLPSKFSKLEKAINKAIPKYIELNSL